MFPSKIIFQRQFAKYGLECPLRDHWKVFGSMDDLRELIYAVAQSTVVAQLLTKPLPANAPQFYNISHFSTLHISQGRCEAWQAHNNFIQIFEFRWNLASFTSYLKLVSVSNTSASFAQIWEELQLFGVYGGAHFFPDQQLGGLGRPRKTEKSMNWSWIVSSCCVTEELSIIWQFWRLCLLWRCKWLGESSWGSFDP